MPGRSGPIWICPTLRWLSPVAPPISACAPHCGNRACGDDGCGGSCGSCPSGQTCSSHGRCAGSCTPTTCAARNAGCGSIPDGCGGSLDCGGCDPPNTCGGGAPNVCGCTPNCTNPDGSGRRCGDDGCGGSCGSCPSGQPCQAGACTCLAGGTACGSNADCCSLESIFAPGQLPGACTCCDAARTGTALPGQACQTTADCCFSTCRGGLCAPTTGATSCTTGGFPRCDAVQNCFSVNTLDSGVVCANLPQVNNRCTDLPGCAASTECGAGAVCVQDPCCTSPLCMPICQQTET